MSSIRQTLPLFLGSVFLISCQRPRAHHDPSASRFDVPRSPLWRVADPEASRRLDVVWREIDLSPGHAWAGRYVLSDKPNADRLAVAPKAGFVLIAGKAGSCCKAADGGRLCAADCPGSREAVFGDIFMTPEGRLRLALELSPGNIISAGEYVPINVGGQHYLISGDELEVFNQAIEDGEEPRSKPGGRYFLRESEQAIAHR